MDTRSGRRVADGLLWVGQLKLSVNTYSYLRKYPSIRYAVSSYCLFNTTIQRFIV
jgi:hypothetical protein